MYVPKHFTGALQGHVARKNEHWRAEPIGEAMVIARGPDAYISPGWYASKAEHGKVVPTWFDGVVAGLEDRGENEFAAATQRARRRRARPS